MAATMRRWLAPSGLLAVIFPAALLFLWWLATHNHPDGLIPPPDRTDR
jgi:ABC-type nitrate/sulfonate/bicarbonate transport system permease component